jgi:uncharacterized protein DUF4396
VNCWNNGRYPRARYNEGDMPHSHGQEHASSHERQGLNQLTFAATWHCLSGCAIGEVLGLVIATALGWGNAASIALAVVLAFLFGYSLTLWPLVRGGLALPQAARVALAADSVSIAVMGDRPIARGRGRGHAVAHEHH